MREYNLLDINHPWSILEVLLVEEIAGNPLLGVICRLGTSGIAVIFLLEDCKKIFGLGNVITLDEESGTTPCIHQADTKLCAPGLCVYMRNYLLHRYIYLNLGTILLVFAIEHAKFEVNLLSILGPQREFESKFYHIQSDMPVGEQPASAERANDVTTSVIQCHLPLTRRSTDGTLPPQLLLEGEEEYVGMVHSLSNFLSGIDTSITEFVDLPPLRVSDNHSVIVLRGPVLSENNHSSLRYVYDDGLEVGLEHRLNPERLEVDGVEPTSKDVYLKSKLEDLTLYSYRKSQLELWRESSNEYNLYSAVDEPMVQDLLKTGTSLQLSKTELRFLNLNGNCDTYALAKLLDQHQLHPKVRDTEQDSKPTSVCLALKGSDHAFIDYELTPGSVEAPGVPQIGLLNPNNVLRRAALQANRGVVSLASVSLLELGMRCTATERYYIEGESQPAPNYPFYIQNHLHRSAAIDVKGLQICLHTKNRFITAYIQRDQCQGEEKWIAIPSTGDPQAGIVTEITGGLRVGSHAASLAVGLTSLQGDEFWYGKATIDRDGLCVEKLYAASALGVDKTFSVGLLIESRDPKLAVVSFSFDVDGSLICAKTYVGKNATTPGSPTSEWEELDHSTLLQEKGIWRFEFQPLITRSAVKLLINSTVFLFSPLAGFERQAVLEGTGKYYICKFSGKIMRLDGKHLVEVESGLRYPLDGKETIEDVIFREDDSSLRIVSRIPEQILPLETPLTAINKKEEKCAHMDVNQNDLGKNGVSEIGVSKNGVGSSETAVQSSAVVMESVMESRVFESSKHLLQSDLGDHVPTCGVKFAGERAGVTYLGLADHRIQVWLDSVCSHCMGPLTLPLSAREIPINMCTSPGKKHIALLLAVRDTDVHPQIRHTRVVLLEENLFSRLDESSFSPNDKFTVKVPDHRRNYLSHELAQVLAVLQQDDHDSHCLCRGIDNVCHVVPLSAFPERRFSPHMLPPLLAPVLSIFFKDRIPIDVAYTDEFSLVVLTHDTLYHIHERPTTKGEWLVNQVALNYPYTKILGLFPGSWLLTGQDEVQVDVFFEHSATVLPFPFVLDSEIVLNFPFNDHCTVLLTACGYAHVCHRVKQQTEMCGKMHIASLRSSEETLSSKRVSQNCFEVCSSRRGVIGHIELFLDDFVVWVVPNLTNMTPPLPPMAHQFEIGHQQFEAIFTGIEAVDLQRANEWLISTGSDEAFGCHLAPHNNNLTSNTATQQLLGPMTHTDFECWCSRHGCADLLSNSHRFSTDFGDQALGISHLLRGAQRLQNLHPSFGFEKTQPMNKMTAWEMAPWPSIDSECLLNKMQNKMVSETRGEKLRSKPQSKERSKTQPSEKQSALQMTERYRWINLESQAYEHDLFRLQLVFYLRQRKIF